jgi:hypothetical protein
VQPYVIKQGDYLAALAATFGFDADAVWNDPANADLQKLRKDPNILWPTDILYIPDQIDREPATQSLTPGTTNNFTSDPPTITLTVKFVGPDGSPYASKAYTVQELANLTGLQTDASGVATFQAPVTLKRATLSFTDAGQSCSIAIGGLDPVNTLSGIFQRLQNLGYIGADVVFDSSNLGVLRAGLSALKQAQAAPPSSAPPSSPGPASAPASAPAPASSPPASAAPTSAPASSPGAGPASAPASSPAPDSAPASSPAPDSAPPSSGGPDSAPVSGPAWSDVWSAEAGQSSPPDAPDDCGLADDGTLDDATGQLLVQAHGS